MHFCLSGTPVVNFIYVNLYLIRILNLYALKTKFWLINFFLEFLCNKEQYEILNSQLNYVKFKM